jgi:hypothetical protein
MVEQSEAARNEPAASIDEAIRDALPDSALAALGK